MRTNIGCVALLSGTTGIATERDAAGESKLAGKRDPVILPAFLLMLFAMHTAYANPVGGTVVSGQASFDTSGSTLTVTNTPGAIINWQGFSIGSTEITQFAQQNGSTAVLNPVVNSNPILGTLSSNGRVFLINPNGIIFGAGATIHTAAFSSFGTLDPAKLTASTNHHSDADLFDGRFNLTHLPGAQNLSNAGNVTALDGGQIFLIPNGAENTGVITSPNGEILLAAGRSVDLVNSDTPNLIVSITAPAGNATNVGQLIASSGRLGLFGTVVRSRGNFSTVNAEMRGGKIVFRPVQRVGAQ